MRVLDLGYCLGGWAEGFKAEGFHVTGLDIRDLSKHQGYCKPDLFIKEDIFDWEPAEYYPVIVASMPCSEFSRAKYYAYGTQKERQGLDLVQRALFLIQKAKPQFWAMENVAHLADFIGPPQKVVKYNKHPGGKKAYLWGNFPDFELEEEINHRHDNYGNSDPRRSKIPTPLSSALAKAIKRALTQNA